MENLSPLYIIQPTHIWRYSLRLTKMSYIVVVELSSTVEEPGEEGGSVRHLRRDAEMNRERVLASARELFAQYGLQTTLDEIAHHAGVGVGTVYRRFSSKEALVEALFEQRVQAIVDLANESLLIANSWEGFVHFLENLISMEASDRGLRELVLSNDYGGERLQALKDQVEAPASEIVERAKRDGYLREDFAATDIVVITAMLGTADEYCSQLVPGMWRRYFTYVLDGLRPSRTSSSEIAYRSLSMEEMKCAMGSWRRRFQRAT